MTQQPHTSIGAEAGTSASAEVGSEIAPAIDWAAIEAANRQLCAFNDFDFAAAACGSHAAQGALAGVRLGVKANIAVAGLPWTAGCAAYRQRIAETDAEVVARLRAAGALVLGTLNMEEAAMGAQTANIFYGTTQNPHRLGYSAGGSSGGSGAAVAAGLCDVALGSDTLGSVRIPAAYCGVYGFKPAQGAVSQHGLQLVEATLDCIGPIATSLSLLQTAYQTMANTSLQVTDETQTSNESIALLRNLGNVDCEDTVRQAYAAAVDHCQAEDSIDLPYSLSRIRFAGFIISCLGLAESLGDILKHRPETLSSNLRKLLTYGSERDADKLAEDRKILAETRAALHEVLAKHSAILLPTAPQAAFSHATAAPANQADFTCLANIAGLPAISLPAGYNQHGLPVAVQLIGAAGRESALFALARKLDDKLRAQHFPHRTPQIFVKR